MSYMIDQLTCTKENDLDIYERVENVPLIPHTQLELIEEGGMNLTFCLLFC